MGLTKKTPFKFKNCIQWIATDVCNYRCGYCLAQSKSPLPTSPLQLTDGLKNNLKGKWEIIISGGEPFTHNDFLETVRGLVEFGHRISVFTNFSAKPEKIVEFLKITRGQLSGFFASLHLEYAKPEDFLKKIGRIEKAWPGFKRRLFVCSVGIPKNLVRLKKIKQEFFEAGVQMMATVYQNPDLSFFRYSASEKFFLRQINENNNLPEYGAFAVAYGGHGLELSSVNFKGGKCPAGQKSFFLIPPGDAYRCLASYRVKKDYLGNVLRDNLKLKKLVGKCSFGQCSCPALYDQYFWWQDYDKKKNSVQVS